ncbi:hypothetical protein LX36DRAFT_152377 [Colletotrichum falcatum]|nr:hypothetical protein LX36DRAFT_152377 [Colletotrichum falcatum]
MDETGNLLPFEICFLRKNAKTTIKKKTPPPLAPSLVIWATIRSAWDRHIPRGWRNPSQLSSSHLKGTWRFHSVLDMPGVTHQHGASNHTDCVFPSLSFSLDVRMSSGREDGKGVKEYTINGLRGTTGLDAMPLRFFLSRLATPSLHQDTNTQKTEHLPHNNKQNMQGWTSFTHVLGVSFCNLGDKLFFWRTGTRGLHRFLLCDIAGDG